ncbi:MAG: hypothetical protein KA792_05510 [Bacteroidales bacterium]|nr:hypothetical protein [Bacteroidales bacterium]
MNKKDLYEFISGTRNLNNESLQELRLLLKEFPYCQTLYLLLIKNLHNQGDIMFDNYLKKAAVYAGDREKLYWLINEKQETVNKNEIMEIAPASETEVNSFYVPPVDEEKKRKFDLIDKFISENPVITAPTEDELQDRHNLSGDSQMDNEEIVSETLAKIYLNQENYPKAVRIYEKLIELIPERKGYYISQIEKIKQINK